MTRPRRFSFAAFLITSGSLVRCDPSLHVYLAPVQSSIAAQFISTGSSTSIATVGARSIGELVLLVIIGATK